MGRAKWGHTISPIHFTQPSIQPLSEIWSFSFEARYTVTRITFLSTQRGRRAYGEGFFGAGASASSPACQRATSPQLPPQEQEKDIIFRWAQSRRPQKQIRVQTGTRCRTRSAKTQIPQRTASQARKIRMIFIGLRTQSWMCVFARSMLPGKIGSPSGNAPRITSYGLPLELA